MMSEKISNTRELEAAQKLYREKADRHLIYMKESFNMAKSESRKALINNILIPGAVATGSFFAIRALLRKSKKNRIKQKHPVQTVYANELKRVDWFNIVVKVLPLLVGVGKRLYEEDNLPFVRNPRSKE